MPVLAYLGKSMGVGDAKPTQAGRNSIKNLNKLQKAECGLA